MTVGRGGTDWLKSQTRRVSQGADLAVDLQSALSVRVEAWLQEQGVDYAPPGMIPLDQIDQARSRGNQARREPIVQDSVDRFATAMRSGAPFPPIVCFPLSGKLVVVDGNNRFAAARKAGLERIYGIVISEQTPSELIQRMTVGANASHGVTPELSWRLEQAFHLIELGYTDVLAAESAAVTPQQIANHRRLKEADGRAYDMRISGFERLPATSRALFGVLKDDPVFYRAAKCALQTEMTIDEVRDMIRMVKNYNSEGAKIAAIDDLHRERSHEQTSRRALGRKPGSSRTLSPKGQLISGVGMVTKVDPSTLAKSILTEHDRGTVRDRLNQIQKHIALLQAQVDAIEISGEG